MTPFRIQEHEDGQGMVEYGLILVLVSVVAIAALVILGTGIDDQLYQTALNAIP